MNRIKSKGTAKVLEISAIALGMMVMAFALHHYLAVATNDPTAKVDRYMETYTDALFLTLLRSEVKWMVGQRANCGVNLPALAALYFFDRADKGKPCVCINHSSAVPKTSGACWNSTISCEERSFSCEPKESFTFNETWCGWYKCTRTSECYVKYNVPEGILHEAVGKLLGNLNLKGQWWVELCHLEKWRGCGRKNYAETCGGCEVKGASRVYLTPSFNHTFSLVSNIEVFEEYLVLCCRNGGLSCWSWLVNSTTEYEHKPITVRIEVATAI